MRFDHMEDYEVEIEVEPDFSEDNSSEKGIINRLAGFMAKLIITVAVVGGLGYWIYSDFKTEYAQQLQQTKERETVTENTSIVETDGYFKISDEVYNDFFVWTDPETGVQYIVYDGYNKGGITPRLNVDGSVIVVDVQEGE